MKLSKFLLLMGVFMTMNWGISSSSWFSIWAALEINNMMIIPLMMMKTSQQYVESTTKYFLVQAMSSTVFIILSMSINMPIFYQNQFFLITPMMMMMMMMKIGMFPFFMWYPDVISKANFLSIKIILTIQKILPMTIIGFLINMNWSNPMIWLIIMNAIIGSIAALNQMNMKKIIAFSSMSHMSWMITSMIMNYSTFIIYFIIYMSITLLIIDFMKIKKIKIFTQMFLIKNLILNLNILSLAGLPPFSGFIMKWIIIDFLMMNQMIMLSMGLIMASLMSLYFYLRLMINGFMTTSTKMKWKKSIPQTKTYMKMLSIMNLTMIPFILFFSSML